MASTAMPVQLPESVRAFLEEVHFATIATANRDGSVHQTALWYALRGDTIVMNTGTASKKVRNLKRDPRASVCVVDCTQARHVTIEGSVSFDDQHVLEDLTLLASRYAGASAGPGIAQNIAKVPHVTLALSIDRIKTFGKL
jgi:PPOX class probable F420-dependent enzyme